MTGRIIVVINFNVIIGMENRLLTLLDIDKILGSGERHKINIISSEPAAAAA